MEKINSLDILQLLVTTAVLYVIFMVIYLAATYIIFHGKLHERQEKSKAILCQSQENQHDVHTGGTASGERE